MGKMLSRRSVLIGGLGGLGLVTAAGAGALADVLPGGARLRYLLGLTGPDGEIPDAPAGPAEVERVWSAARGTDVDLVVIRPAGSQRELPVALALHGRGAGARSFLDMGVPRFLTAATKAGVPPFAVVAVDGGESYFVARDDRDNPLRMLVEELPEWLGERGLPQPAAAFGISMGCFGSLRYARERKELRAVGVIGPALFRSWAEARERNVFRDEQQWAANEPLRHTKDIDGIPLGVWCGTDDPFVDSARELVDRTKPAVASIGPGAHENGYFLRVLPDVMRFIGQRVGQSG